VRGFGLGESLRQHGISMRTQEIDSSSISQRRHCGPWHQQHTNMSNGEGWCNVCALPHCATCAVLAPCMRSQSLSHDALACWRWCSSSTTWIAWGSTLGCASTRPSNFIRPLAAMAARAGASEKNGQPVSQQTPAVAAATEAAAATATASTYGCNCGPPARRPGSEEQPALTQAQMNAHHNPPCCMALNFMPKTLTHTRVNMRPGWTKQPARACMRARCCCNLLQLSGSRSSSAAFPVHLPGQAQ